MLPRLGLLLRRSPISQRLAHNPARRLLFSASAMSMQTLPVLNDSELSDGQMKEVEFGEGGKVLLSRLGDKVHATSAFCTHYGAPLAKGVLTADGRVVCPWHGACFNVCTGDIEDAPALDAIHSFSTSIQDGKIYVTGNPVNALKDNKARPPTLRADSAVEPGKGVLIVGGGAGAIHAVESLRENGYRKNITILSTERYAPIDRTRLSKGLPTDPSKLEWRNASDLKIKYDTNLRIGAVVTSVDTASKTVTLENGEKLEYEDLILSPGGAPRRLPVEGANLSNVYTLRHVQDAQKIDAAAKEGQRLVVIGSSFISMELVVAVAKRKLASIDVIGLEEVPFEAVLGKDVGRGLQQYHESQGVKFHMQSKVSKILPSTSDSSLAGSVIVQGPSGDETTLEADFVVMGVGVGPATKFLKDSPGWELERDGGVRVDEYLRVVGKEHVYAVGDIAHFPQAETGEVRRIEHWNVAGNHGRAVGRAIAGKPEPFAKIPVFWSAQGQQLRYAGIGVGFDEVHIDGNPAELKFVAYYLKGDKVIAIASMQADPLVIKASELMRLGLMPSASQIKSGVNLLEVDVSSVAARGKV